MKKKSVLSLLLAAALALSLAGCAGQGQPGGKEPVVNSDGTITKEENDVKITETAARSIETELYETADFSLQIPKGWTVTSGGTAMYHSIRVQDPSQPLNQMFVLLHHGEHMGADAFPGAGADNPLHRKLFQAVFGIRGVCRAVGAELCRLYLPPV